MAGKFSSVDFPNTDLIKLYAENVIGDALDKIFGSKDVVLDQELMSPLDRIMGASALKAHNVDKIFKLENPTAPIRRSTKRVYIVRNRPQLMRTISGQIIMDRGAGVQCQYTILMVPRKLYLCEKVLEEEGVYGHVTLDDLPINLVVIDDDILSLESKSFHRSYFMDKDQTSLHEVAQSLCDVQKIFGRFDNVFCIGSCSQKVDHLKNLLDLREERSKLRSKSNLTHSNHKSKAGHFTHLIMVDRDVDLVTPLCSQVTYEGLIDDTLGVNCGYVQLGPEVTNLQKSTKVLLSSKDKLFQEIRDRHFSNLSTFLSSKAKELRQGYEKQKTLDLPGTKVFIQNELKGLMSQHNSLSIHVAASEYISKKKIKGEIDLLLRAEHSLLEGIDIKDSVTYLEEMMNRQTDMCKCLNLLCLLSVTEGGLSTTTYESLVLQFLQSYGYPHLASISNLKRVGLLTELVPQNIINRVVSFNPQGAYRTVARRMNLIPRSPELINLKSPNDMSYVFSGAYSPLMCKIIEQILVQEGVQGLEEVFRLLNVSTRSFKENEGW